MNKKIIIIPIVIIIVIGLVGFSSNEDSKRKDIVFHVTLADPILYVDGTYTDKITIEEGEYFFRFVPNGSSPKILTISIMGDSFEFNEDFRLKNKLHQTGISEYFTWEYQGTHSFTMYKSEEVEIIVNPNGETMGSVSVDILEN